MYGCEMESSVEEPQGPKNAHKTKNHSDHIG